MNSILFLCAFIMLYLRFGKYQFTDHSFSFTLLFLFAKQKKRSSIIGLFQIYDKRSHTFYISFFKIAKHLVLNADHQFAK